MALSFSYVSGGKMYIYLDGKTAELRSGVLESYSRTVRSAAERNEWKYSGTGAAFTGVYQPEMNAERASEVFSAVRCIGKHNGDILYSIDIDGTNGIYRKSASAPMDDGIVLCSANVKYRDFDVSGDKIVTSAKFGRESHIGIYDINTKSFVTYTDGHTLDGTPVFSKTDPSLIYYCSVGLPTAELEEPEERTGPMSYSEIVNDMYRSGGGELRGPSSLLSLDISSGSLYEMYADERYDYIKPFSASDGSLYYIRRPYSKGRSERAPLGCLLDAVMLPVRLVQALFGFLNVFSAKYSGKTLSRSDTKRKAEKDLIIEGNLINAERELKANEREGDKNPGIIPRSWELRKLSPDGTDLLVKAGVLAYRINEKSGDILVSNGSSILRIASDGKEEKLLTAEKVSFIF